LKHSILQLAGSILGQCFHAACDNGPPFQKHVGQMASKFSEVLRI